MWENFVPRKLQPIIKYILFNALNILCNTAVHCIPEYRDFSTAEIGFLPNLVNLKGKMLQNMPK